MYINPFHVSKGIYNVLVANVDLIGGEIRRFWSTKTINFFIGKRQTIPVNHMPCLEIVCTGVTPEWFACRTQNMIVTVELTLTLQISKEDNVEQLIGTISTPIVEILTNPVSLQFEVQSEKRLEQVAPLAFEYIRRYNEGKALADKLVWTAPEPDTSLMRRMWDSFVTGVSYNTANGGAYAQAIISWEGKILQPYLADWRQFRETLQPGWSIEHDFLSS